MKKYIFLLSLTTLLISPITALAAPTNLSPLETSSTVIEPFADDIRYQYTVIDGILYKRLYNYSKNKPIGSWEKVV